MMKEDDRISKKRCVNLSLGIVESKNKKETKKENSRSVSIVIEAP